MILCLPSRLFGCNVYSILLSNHFIFSALSFQALQKRDSMSAEQSFANPLYDEPNILLEKRRKLEEKGILSIENIYSPEPKINQNENPLYDVMVDINKEAEKDDDDLDLLKKSQDQEDLIYSEIPEKATMVDIHEPLVNKSAKNVIFWENSMEKYSKITFLIFQNRICNKIPVCRKSIPKSSLYSIGIFKDEKYLNPIMVHKS